MEEQRLMIENAKSPNGDSLKNRFQNNNERMINQYLNDKNLNEYEKVQAVKRKANQMEEKARMQEKLLVMNKRGVRSHTQNSNEDIYTDNIEQTIAVNDMYIDAIQAKLKILD